MTIRVTVWGENVHEQKNKVVAEVYPKTMHGTIAEFLNKEDGIKATTVTLQDPEHGMTAARLAETDVLVWWGHAAHGEVKDEIVERVAEAVWSGMGVIFLHSAHFSKPFKRLMGAPCNLSWREAGERERIWVTSRQHPIARRASPTISRSNMKRCMASPSVPELETVFISWFQGGEVFRSGLTYAARAISSTSARGMRPIRPITSRWCRRSSPTASAGPSTLRRDWPKPDRPTPSARRWNPSSNAARCTMTARRDTADATRPSSDPRHRRHGQEPCRTFRRRSPASPSSPGSTPAPNSWPPSSRHNIPHGFPSVQDADRLG
jgi:trehalose utilization protein